MATFSFPSHPFLLDSIFLPNTPTKMSGFMDESNINYSNFLSPFYGPHHPIIQDSPVCPIFHESSSLVHSDNEEPSSVTKKQSTDDNSTVVDDKLESGEQVTQRKRTRNRTTLNPSQIKGAKQSKTKKQKKCNDEDGLKNEKKECKADKKVQKKVSDEPPTGYIHVRARRGQATDSHSLAERVRREKISERMKTLQRLVPGCDKVTGKALMLDEIINYVQSLQNQVEFLSMKLASLNPMLYDFGVELETLMIRPERVNSSSRPVQMGSCVQQVEECNPIIETTLNNYPLLDVSTALFLQQPQRPNVFTHPQDNGSILWEVEEQRQKNFNSSHQLNDNNLCSFH